MAYAVYEIKTACGGVKFTAPELYARAKAEKKIHVFWKHLPDCIVTLQELPLYMTLNLREVHRQTKSNRRKLLAYFLLYSEDYDKQKAAEWINSNFTPEVSAEVFELMTDGIKLYPEPQLEKAMATIKNKRRKEKRL